MAGTLIPFSVNNGKSEPIKSLRGVAQEFYKNVVRKYEGNNCLEWPHTRSSGYGQMWLNGRMHIVSRVLCEELHGPPPTVEHEAAHSCGNGRSGCVTKRHLSWKTAKENAEDKLIHGTHTRGDKNGNAKLNEAQAREIFAFAGKEKSAVTAKRYGVDRKTVREIQSKKTWAWLHQ